MFTKRLLHREDASSYSAEKCACNYREKCDPSSARTIYTRIAAAGQEHDASYCGAEVEHYRAGDQTCKRADEDIR